MAKKKVLKEINLKDGLIREKEVDKEFSYDASIMTEDEFFNNESIAKIQKEVLEKKSGKIETSMAQGVTTMIGYLGLESTRLTRDERIGWALTHDDPLFGQYTEKMITTKRNEKGWFTKVLFKFFNAFMKPFHTIYYNKQVRKALSKAGFNNNLFDD